MVHENSLANLKTDAGPGRPLGSKNKIHGMTKEAFGQVLEKLNATELLHDWALNNPALFKDIWKQLLPKAVELTGEGGNPIEVKTIERKIIDPTD